MHASQDGALVVKSVGAGSACTGILKKGDVLTIGREALAHHDSVIGLMLLQPLHAAPNFRATRFGAVSYRIWCLTGNKFSSIRFLFHSLSIAEAASQSLSTQLCSAPLPLFPSSLTPSSMEYSKVCPSLLSVESASHPKIETLQLMAARLATQTTLGMLSTRGKTRRCSPSASDGAPHPSLRHL